MLLSLHVEKKKKKTKTTGYFESNPCKTSQNTKAISSQIFFFFFKQGSHVVQAGLELLVPLSPTPKCWHYILVTLCPSAFLTKDLHAEA